ncbi:MAG: RNA methyltransferase [Candidatus Promineifilaceae bacterium]|nr:RNA methyltransferase [Candidatus Promineifilaceae bacterium]
MITSFRNPLVKRIKKLKQKKYRQREGAFFIEGIRVVLSALERGAPVEALVVAPELLTSDVAWEAVAEQRAQGVEVREVSGEVFESFAERDNPVGLGAIVGVRLRDLASLPAGPEDVFAALFDVGDPGNLGTIVRTLDGVGAAGLILVGQTTDPFHPTSVKASMGALFNVPVAEAETVEAMWRWAEGRGVHTVATSAHARQVYWDAAYALPALLLLGSEGEGLPADVMERAEQTVTIPMVGASSSLNLAVAAGLLLYEVRRQIQRNK